MLFADFLNSKFWFPEFFSRYAWHVTLCICEGLSDPSILDNVTKISYSGSNSFWLMFYRTYLVSFEKVEQGERF